MKAEDLRIGNWIESKWDGSKILKVGKVHNSNVNNVPINLIHPIPLTEEILLKSGFEFDSGWLEFGKISISFDDKRCVMEDEGGESWSKLPYPKYVHTLQNLYFALTGEELEIQL